MFASYPADFRHINRLSKRLDQVLGQGWYGVNCLHAVKICLLFLSSVDFFLNNLFQKKSFRNTIKVSKSLDPDQAQHFVRPDLGPNCLQR